MDAGWRVGGPPRWEGGAGRIEGGWEGGGLLFIVSSEGLLESLHRILLVRNLRVGQSLPCNDDHPSIW